MRYLKHAKVPLNEYQFPTSKLANVQGQLEKLIDKNYYLNQSAKDGYRSYLQAYSSFSLKKIFDVNSLDLAKVAKAFGFSAPPKVNLGTIKQAKKLNEKTEEEKTGEEKTEVTTTDDKKKTSAPAPKKKFQKHKK